MTNSELLDKAYKSLERAETILSNHPVMPSEVAMALAHVQLANSYNELVR